MFVPHFYPNIVPAFTTQSARVESLWVQRTQLCETWITCLEWLVIYTIYKILPSPYVLLAGGRNPQWSAIKAPLGKLLTNNLSEQDDALMSPLSSPDTFLSIASSGHHIWNSFQGWGWALLSSKPARTEQEPKACYLRGQLWRKGHSPHICLYRSTEHFHKLSYWIELYLSSS